MRYHPHLLQGEKAAELETVAQLSSLPILWAIPDLLPCHRLTLFTGPSGVGLTELALRLLAQVAPAGQFLDTDSAPAPLVFSDRGAGLQPATPTPAARERGMEQPTHPTRASVSSPVGEDQGGGTPPHQHLDTTGFAPEDLLPDPNDPDWDPMLPLVPQPAEPALPTALLISSRDDADVLRPRLLAAGVDPHRVLILSEIIARDEEDPDPTPIRRPFAFEDATFLERLLHEHKSIRLVVIDNAELLAAYQSRPLRAKLQRQLLSLQHVARQREVAIALFTPIPRLSAAPFRTSFLSVLNEVCRRVFLLAPGLPHQEDQRYLFCLKNTLPGPIPTLQLHPTPAVSFPATSVPSPLEEGQGGGIPPRTHPEPTPTPLLPGTSPCELTYSTYLQLRRRHGPIPYARLLAEAFLRLVLAEGPLPVGDRHSPPAHSLRAQAQAAGLSWGTIRRAATELNLRIFRTADCWYWQLPASSSAQPPALGTATCAPSIPTNDQGPITNDQELTTDNKPTCAPSPTSPHAQPQPAAQSMLAPCA